MPDEPVPNVTVMSDKQIEALAEQFIAIMRRRAADPDASERDREAAREMLEAVEREREARGEGAR